jgi:2-hydroxy-6-oxonona-2,4-dienedioate hydrolase
LNTKLSILHRDIPLSAFAISLTATILVLVEGLLWILQQSAFAAQFNAGDLLFHFGPAALMAACTILLLRRPIHNRVLGFGIGFFALLSLLAGGGFLAGLVLGLIAAVLAVAWNSKRRIVAPLQTKLVKLGKRNSCFLVVVVAVIAVLVVMPTEVSYQMSMYTAQQSLLSGSKLLNTPDGLIEYTDVGEGYPVLVSHGTGLGYTQVQSVEQMIGAEGYRFIVPSRFGYLRTPLPSNASFAAQADLFADLLDALNISKVIIMGVSIGGPAALAFAEQYPDRCSALVMASAVSHTTPDFDLMGTIIHQVVFRSDFGFWVLSTSLQSELISFIGVSQQVQANMTSADKQYVSDMLQAMQPIGLRQTGMVNDPTHSAYELNNFPIESITMPTLVFHAKDDTLVPFDHGQYTAEHILRAKFIQFESGGHLLVGQTGIIKNETRAFLIKNQIIG